MGIMPEFLLAIRLGCIPSNGVRQRVAEGVGGVSVGRIVKTGSGSPDLPRVTIARKPLRSPKVSSMHEDFL